METYSIGIDIGGTNTDIGLVRSDGVVIGRQNLPTNKYFDADVYVSDICDKIKQLMADNKVAAIDGIGIAAPAGNFYTGCIENATNLNFKGYTDLPKLVHKHLDVPVVVSNDANAAAYGELVYGGAKGMKHFIMFTLGTGVGSGVVVDGKLVHGKTGGAGELGHAILIPEGRQCGCGRKGCLETYCSATGIRRTALEMLEENPDYNGILAQTPKDELTSKTVGDAAQNGDSLALKVFEKDRLSFGHCPFKRCNFQWSRSHFPDGRPCKGGRSFAEAFARIVLQTFAFHL